MEEKVVEAVAAAILIARAGRMGARGAHGLDVLALVEPEHAEEARADARAAIAAMEEARRELIERALGAAPRTDVAGEPIPDAIPEGEIPDLGGEG